MSKIAPQEAEELLRRLSEHFGQPVMPIDRYCVALTTWQRCLEERTERLKEKLYPGIHGDDKAAREAAWALYKAEQEARGHGDRASQIDQLRSYESSTQETGHVFLQIRKSNLLARLLYDGEQLRKQPCPMHDGRWSGCVWNDAQLCACMSGCNVTGWLANEDDPVAIGHRPTESALVPCARCRWGAVPIARRGNAEPLCDRCHSSSGER